MAHLTKHDKPNMDIYLGLPLWAEFCCGLSAFCRLPCCTTHRRSYQCSRRYRHTSSTASAAVGEACEETKADCDSVAIVDPGRAVVAAAGGEPVASSPVRRAATTTVRRWSAGVVAVAGCGTGRQGYWPSVAD